MVERLRVLIADDNATDRLLLKFLLRGLGHDTIEAVDGREAIHRFIEFAPALVILADELPVVDGPEAGRQIKQLAGDGFVAVIYSTAQDDAVSLNRCLASGGDDFLLKPFNGVVLRAKLNAFLRMMQMHQTLRRQHQEIADHNAHLLHEQEIAKRIFDRVAHAGCLNLPNIRYHLSPMAVFNGDVVLAATGPSGNLVVLHGDFTGHGLAAAIGAMPLAQTFYGMVSKGFSLREVLSEINLKLYEILPTEVFCCACAVDIDFTQQRMQFWNGGLPDCYVYRAATAGIERLVSHDLPLGIRAAADFDLQLQMLTVAPGDRIYLWSDGIVEASNTHGIAFGDAGLQRVFRAGWAPSALFDAVTEALRAHVQDRALADDLSLVEIAVVPESEFGGMASTQLQAFGQPPLDWSVAYEFRADSLRHLNPLPLVLHNLMEISALRAYSGPLYTVMSELYSNALEHGVLQLDSAIKASAEGFARYYELRAQSLQQLQQGFIRITLRCTGDRNGGELEIDVEDSGAGFDTARLTAHTGSDSGTYRGRGYPLLCQLCRSVRYYPPGNRVVVCFAWAT